MPVRGIALAIVIIGGCLAALGLSSDLLVDWLWFSSIGYARVFWTIFDAQLLIFFAVFAASAGLVWLNGSLASRFACQRAGPPSFVAGSARSQTLFGLLGATPLWVPRRFLIPMISSVIGILIAATETGNWGVVLRFLHQAPYGMRDPLYGNDIGFYLFSLPAYIELKAWIWLVLLASAAFAFAVYWVEGAIELDRRPLRFSRVVIAHGSALLGVFFAVKGWSYALDRYLLLYGDNGVVVGASYSDVHVELPVLWLLIVVAATAALACWTNVRIRRFRLPLAALGLVFGSSILLGTFLPGGYERLYVKPNELQLETPYLQRNIALTREAYNLRQIAVKPFPAEQDLTYQSLQDNRATIDNIRLWDWQPLIDTYAQLQEIRTYYKFLDVDVDRYDLNGSYQQVMLSARELDPRLLPLNAQTWVNLHLLFTHGNGIVMSPVTRKSAEGLPILYLQDIPPVATGGPAIRQPRLYFGQGADTYVIVKTGTREFDYPKGSDNVYSTYDGADGVAIGGIASKTLFAWYFNDPNILLSRYITAESRILFRRNVQERVRTIAPFLLLDRDPYIVVSDGRLFWIQDAYTTSEWFPYTPPLRSGPNYIRNSVKIAIDAYNGSVSFYVTDPADPIVAAYQRIFPRMFKPIAAMPADLRKHIRYPEDLFLIQAAMYRTYHMEAPEVFYNREDLWQFPREPTSPDAFGAEEAKMAPYYIMMRLPQEAQTEFFIMLPMVPNRRENMIAWLAARCDAPDYGKLIVYEFPKEKLVYGPFQIEARINQNTEISQQISLWNQMGSRVIRGNLLVVPIENSILYVSPLYLRAQLGQLPELKRVIAAYGDTVVMRDTLDDALAALFQAPALAPALPPAGPAAPPGSVTDRAREALAHYDRAIARLKEGDWSGFGAELDALRPLLKGLSQPPGPSP